VCVRSYLERSPIALKDVVLLVHCFDTAKLIKACTEEEMDVLSMEGGLFDKLCSLYQLDDTLGCDVELVCFGLSGSLHFSECCWVVNAARLYAFDSCLPAGHADITSTVIEPFINYVIDRCVFIEPNELRMANGPIVEAQPIESNICAFSASLCFGKVCSPPPSTPTPPSSRITARASTFRRWASALHFASRWTASRRRRPCTRPTASRRRTH